MGQRVLLAIQSYGAENAIFSLDEIVAKTRLQRQQIYSTMYRLREGGFLEVITDTIPGTKQRKINGARLLEAGLVPVKLNGTTKPLPAVEASTVPATAPETTERAIRVPHTLEYLAQKNAVMAARTTLINAGLDADSMIAFESSPLGEEALEMYGLLTELRKQHKRLSTQLENANRELTAFRAEKENVAITPEGEPALA